MGKIEGNIENLCNYSIFWPYEEKINPREVAVDLVVRLNKEKEKSYRTDLVTPAYIIKRMAKDKSTGESANGCYFPESKPLIVEEISKDCIEKVLKDIINNGFFRLFFKTD